MALDWKDIGARIRKQREFLGLTREQFAEMVDISPKFCSDIELGVKGMSVNKLALVSDTLKLSVDYILFGNPRDEDPDSAKMILEMLTYCQSPKKKYAVEAIKNIIMAIE